MFELGVKLFDLGVKSFGSDIKPASGQIYRKVFVVYTDEENVDFRKERPMTSFMRIIAETHPGCNRTGVGETTAVCMRVVEMPSV